MNNVLLPSVSRARITSLDALRAFTLLGILIVHAFNGFGFKYCSPQSTLDFLIVKFNDLFLVNKCNTIFAVLFGVSFYLILRNPKNSSAKFVWRCFLLLLIGLFNKLIYSFDILMWYGFWGMVLVLFRNVKPKWLLASSVALIIIAIIFAKFKFGDMLFGPVLVRRYRVEESFIDILTYPDAVKDNLRGLLNSDGFKAFACFLMGYCIAKVGFIEHLQERMTRRIVLITWMLFAALFAADFVLQKHGINDLRRFTNYAGSAAYASAFIYAYYHFKSCNRILRYFEPYGKLGLTNYSVGGICGVIFINEFGLGLYRYPLPFILLFFIGFFLVQAVFSYYWLRYFTYGPMEYVWRVATERKPIPFRRKSLV